MFCAKITLLPTVTGPITTFPIPILLLFPMITGPTPLLIVEKSSIVLPAPNSKRLKGSTSILVLRLITEPFPLL